MNTTETICSAADHAATTAQLLTLVSELRGLRDAASRDRGTAVSFGEIAYASTAGMTNLTPSFFCFLEELAKVLDTHSPQVTNSELDKEWRTAAQAWMKSRT